MKLLKLIAIAAVIGMIGCTQSTQNKLEYGHGIACGQVQYGGMTIPLSSGTSEPDLYHPQKQGMKETAKVQADEYSGTISSVRIGAGLKCEFYEETDYKGGKLGPLGTGEYPDFHAQGWNDHIKSVKCYPAG
ncbi:MAG: hypothetical protein CSYNP_02707 [Syntrophus sp. SKADARSKE-3]|nr:hypothetical protein [Syntrophus sp. SKADARSKE-3]